MPRLSPPGRHPRKGVYADKQGAYTLVVESSDPIAYPGKTITLSVFISGYGEISQAKLYMLVPPEIYDKGHSYFYNGVSTTTEGTFENGVEKSPLCQETIIGLGGFNHAAWDSGSVFADVIGEVPNGAPSIATEYKTPRSILQMELGIRKPSLKTWLKGEYRYGGHAVQFVFTYFNGEYWVSEKIVHTLTLFSWYQRYEFLRWVILLVVALLGLMLTYTQVISTLDVPAYPQPWHYLLPEKIA